MDEVVTRALDGQRKRAIGTIMAAVDNADLFNSDHARIRKAVLDAINDLHRNNLEIVDAALDGMEANELTLDRVAARRTE